MKKLYVVVSKIGDKKKFFADYLGGTLIEIKDFSIFIDTDSIELKLFGDAIDKNAIFYFRRVGDKYLSLVNIIANILANKGIQIIDKSLTKVGWWEDKLANSYFLAKSGIPIIQTIFSYSFDEIKNAFGIPFIAKEMNTHKSQSIWAIRTNDEFRKLINLENKRFVFQKLMKIDKEYRLLVTGNKVATILVKDVRMYEKVKVVTPDGIPEEYLQLNKVSDEIKQMAVASSIVFDLQVAGVDLMIEKDTNKSYIVEVNRGPGITLDVEASPELPELKKYIDSLVE